MLSSHTLRLLRALLLIPSLSAAFAAQPAPAAELPAPQTLESHVFYADGPASDHAVSPWNMVSEQRRTGGPGAGHYLWLNGDWQAKPWAGVRFRRRSGEPWKITADWLANGFVRFLLNGGLDRYGSPNGPVALQVRPEAESAEFIRLPSRLIDQGRGLDEDTESWQEVLIPLRLWTKLKPGDAVSGVSVQCVGQTQRSFGLADVSCVRYDRRPKWVEEAQDRDVAQPQVTWPQRSQLPPLLRADLRPPEVRQGRFVGPDGRRVFILNPYLREDPRLDLLGSTDGRVPPDHGLYDPKRHGWIYQELLTAESLCRLGFNSLSVYPSPEPFWQAVGYQSPRPPDDPSLLKGTIARTAMPFYVDMVCFPWTMGQPAASPDTSRLPAAALTTGPNHWTPYRITGPGRDTWLQIWKIQAQRYREAGASVLMFELFNEPAYVDLGDEHRQEFLVWLRKRHGSLDGLNAAWKAKLASWEEVTDFKDAKDLKKIPARVLDYDEYLAEHFTSLVAAGVKQVSACLPHTLVGVQPMSGYALQPRESVWKHRLVPEETVVLTPTGGGRWSSGGSARQAGKTVVEAAMAGAPLEDDLLLALAGSKMLYDNETYLRGQTALDTRNRLWEHVAAGLDGLTVFAWSRRGWTWWKGREAIITEADKYPYSSLIPLARRTEALRGILDFAREVQPLADRILPKPWGPTPRVGLLYSWPQARRWQVEPSARDKTAQYHAALRYGHWNAAVVPSDHALRDNGLDDFDVLIAAGVRVTEPEMGTRLERFVNQGGTLILGEEPLAEDLYGRALDTAQRLGVTFAAWQGEQNSKVDLPAKSVVAAISGTIERIADLRAVSAKQGQVLFRTAAGKPVVVRRRLGQGLVYASGADLAGYPLAKLLAAILVDAAVTRGADQVRSPWRAAEIRDEQGQLVPNVLLSRRSYPTHHALLLLNRDEYAKKLRLQITDLQVACSAEEALSQAKLKSQDGWYELEIAPLAPAVVLLQPAGLEPMSEPSPPRRAAQQD